MPPWAGLFFFSLQPFWVICNIFEVILIDVTPNKNDLNTLCNFRIKIYGFIWNL